MRQSPRFACIVAAASVVILCVPAAVAAQQPSVYISGAGFGDIKRFDNVEYDPRLVARNSSGSSLDGTAAGGGVRVGTFLHPLWSLELAVDAGSRSTNVFSNPYEALARRSSTLRLPELSSSTRFLTVSTILGFHPAKKGRLQVGYLGGFSFVTGTYRSTIPDFPDQT